VTCDRPALRATSDAITGFEHNNLASILDHGPRR